jgi:4-carboxymuconolactone decarboxylase
MAKEVRFPQLVLEQLTPEARSLAGEIVGISRSGLGGPYNAMLRSPAMAERLKRLLDYLRFGSSLPTRLNELAILIQGRLWTAHVAWRAHVPLAIGAGLPASVAEDLREGRRPAAMQADEAAVYDFCMELSTRHAVSDATFERARALFSDQQIVDLIAVSGTYVTVAMLLSVSEAQLPAGTPPPLPPLPDGAFGAGA